MPNIASLLKDEIVRLARKELKKETESLKRASAQYRSEIAALKRRAASLEQQLAYYEKAAAKNAAVGAPPSAEKKARFTAKGFRTLRQRLGLTAEQAGTLLGVSAQTVYSWEAGNSSPREKQFSRIVMLRGMGKREVASILRQMAG